jgi:hypothetical protein
VRDLIRDRVLQPHLARGFTRPSQFVQVFSGDAYGWSADDIVYNYENASKQAIEALTELREKQEPVFRYLVDEMRRINNSRKLTKRIVFSFLFFFAFHMVFVIAPSFVLLFFTSRLLSQLTFFSIYASISMLFSFTLIAVVGTYLLKTTRKDYRLNHPVDALLPKP